MWGRAALDAGSGEVAREKILMMVWPLDAITKQINKQISKQTRTFYIIAFYVCLLSGLELH